MKILNQLLRLMVVLLALPVVVLLLFEGLFLVFTDWIPGIIRKVPFNSFRPNN